MRLDYWIMDIWYTNNYTCIELLYEHMPTFMLSACVCCTMYTAETSVRTYTSILEVYASDIKIWPTYSKVSVVHREFPIETRDAIASR